MATTKRKSRGTSTGRKATRVAKKSQRVSWLAKGYPVLSSVAVLDDCQRAIDKKHEHALLHVRNFKSGVGW
jgi:hypothetical protein